MRGLAIEVKDWIPSDEFGNHVVGLIVDKEYPQSDVIDALRTCPWNDACWVIRENDRLALHACSEAGIEPVTIGLNPYFKVGNTDVRSVMRECELLYGCTHVLVFRNMSSSVSAHWENRHSPRAQIHVVPYGKAKGRKRSEHSRKSTGVRKG
jgi:hypothetical protein